MGALIGFDVAAFAWEHHFRACGSRKRLELFYELVDFGTCSTRRADTPKVETENQCVLEVRVRCVRRGECLSEYSRTGESAADKLDHESQS